MDPQTLEKDEDYDAERDPVHRPPAQTLDDADMLLVVQGLPNLEEVYGHAGASSLMNACQVHAYMSVNDPQSKQMISRSLGTCGVEITQESTSRSFGSFGGNRTASKQLRAMKLIEEDAINRTVKSPFFVSQKTCVRSSRAKSSTIRIGL